jgi:anti-anti-sigma factor
LHDIQKHSGNTEELKSILRDVANQVINGLTPEAAGVAALRIAKMASEIGATSVQVMDIRDGEIAVVCKGDLDMGAIPTLDAALLQATAKPQARRIVVDLTDTRFIDSTAIGCLVHGLKIMMPRGGSLELVVTSPRLLYILTATGLDRVFTIHASRHDAGIG